MKPFWPRARTRSKHRASAMWKVVVLAALLATASAAAQPQPEKHIDGPVIGIDLGTTCLSPVSVSP